MNSDDSFNEAQYHARKRLMFLTHEDFYFLAYNCIIIMKAMGCTQRKNALKDLRKLSYMIDFATDSYLTESVCSSASRSAGIAPDTKQLLENAYFRSKERLPHVNRLLYAMAKRNYLCTFHESKSGISEGFLCTDSLPSELLASSLFTPELTNMSVFLGTFSRARTSTLDSFLENVFRKKGVKTWLD